VRGDACTVEPAGPVTRLTDVASGCEQRLRLLSELERLRACVPASADPALAAMVHAAGEVAVDWNEREREVERRRRRLDQAMAAAVGGRERLVALLAVIARFAPVNSEAPASGEAPAPGEATVAGSTVADAAAEVPAVECPMAVDRAHVGPGRRGWFGARRQAVRLDQRDDGLASELVGGGLAPGSAGPRALGPGPARASDPQDGAGAVDLAVHLLGPFQLLRHGRPLDTRNGAKSFRVLKYLLAHRHQPIMKDVLIDLFWPDCDFDSVGRNLHQAIYTLRKLLRDGGPDRPYVVFENDAYLLDPTLSIWCDAEEMEAGAAAGRAAEQAGDVLAAASTYERASACYAGEYLADSPYEEWALSERERLRLLYVDVANRLGELRLGMGDVEAAAAVSRQLLRHETCDEEAHRRLIRCYGAAGHRTMVVRQYRAYVECAERMYGVGPAPETTRLYESLIAD
jgi:DNA-binding SARP family transcriptional activator